MASIRVNSRQNYGASPRFCAGGTAHTEVWAVRQCALRAQLKTLELGDMKLGDPAPLHTDGPIYTEMEDQMRYRIAPTQASMPIRHGGILASRGIISVGS